MKTIRSLSLMIFAILCGHELCFGQAPDYRDRFIAEDGFWFAGRLDTNPIPNTDLDGDEGTSDPVIAVAFHFRKAGENDIEVDYWMWSAKEMNEESATGYVYTNRSDKMSATCEIRATGPSFNKVVELSFDSDILGKVRVTRRYSRRHERRLMIRYQRRGPKGINAKSDCSNLQKRGDDKKDVPCEEPAMEDVYVEEEIPVEEEAPVDPDYYPPPVL